MTPPIPHESPVYTVRFSPDSKRIVTASWNGVAQLWDARTGKAVGSAMWHSAAVQSVDFHPSGGSILTGCADGTVRLWTVPLRPSPALTLEPDGRLEHLSLDRSGQRVLTSNSAGEVQIWETTGANAGSRVATMPNAAGSVSFLPGKPLIPFMGVNPVVQFWRSDPGTPGGASLPPGPILPKAKAILPIVAVTPDASRAVIVSSIQRQSSFQVWDLAQGNPVSEVVRGRKVQLFYMSPAGQYLAVVQGSKSPVRAALSFWSTETGRKIGKTIAVDGLAPVGLFSPDGETFALAFGPTREQKPDSSELQAWDVQSGEIAFRRALHTGTTGVLSYDPTGETIAVSHDNRLRIFSAATGRPLTPPMIHVARIRGVRFSPDGRYICSIDHTEFLYVHDTVHGQPIGSPIPHPDSVFDALFTPDSKRIVTACLDGKVRFWELTPETRPVDELTVYAEILSGHKIDRSGGLSPLSMSDCELQWQAWTRTMPAGLNSTPGAGVAAQSQSAGRSLKMSETNAAALQNWNDMQETTVIVPADPRNEIATGILLESGDKYRIFPCPTDSWNTNPQRFRSVDYRGHIREPFVTRGNRPYMQLCYAIEDGKLEAVQAGRIVTGVGKLRLVTSDVEAAQQENNTGFIRVKIARVP